FSRAMSAATLTTSSFTLAGPAGAVAASVSYNGTTNTATLTPAAALAAGTTYTATLAVTVKAADGVALAGAVSWSFTTQSAAPTVTAKSPADGATGVSSTTALPISFSRAMNAATLTTSSFTLAGP